MQFTKKVAGVLALALVMALTSVAIFAQGQTTQGQGEVQAKQGRKWRKNRRGFGGRRGGLFMGRFAEKLNLTDAQKEQMKQIATRYREAAKAQRQQRAAGAERKGFGAFNGGTFDEAAVRAAAQARANARVERQVARARMMSEMYNVLTPEQKAQLATLRQEQMQKRQERRSRRNADSTQTQ
jgi:Spy/CpxP family protein refolding chaperone